MLLVSAVVLAFIWAATEWTAWRLGFQPQLGQPWFEFLGWPVYQPPAFFWWWFAYDAYAPRHLCRRRLHRGVGGVAAIAVAIGMSVWRAREAKTDHDLRLGALGRDDGRSGAPACSSRTAWCSAARRGEYLRHDGPEHVLCFAPTRSGKGVGLVVPTLLTWPGSAIVHDIKGENWQLTAGWRARFGRVLLFDPTNPRQRRLQPAARGAPRRMGGARRPEHRRHPGRSRGRARTPQPLGEDQPSLLVGAILHVLYAEPDKTLAGVANFLSDPRRPIETTLARDDDDAAPRRSAASIRSSRPRRASC